MYGSQFQAEMALTLIRPSTQELANHIHYKTGKIPSKTKLLALIVFTVLAFSISSLCFAGPSQPRIGGGNGNANGR